MTKEEIDELLLTYAASVKDSLGRNYSEATIQTQQVLGTWLMAQMLGEVAIQLQELNHHLMVRDGAVQ